jgi:hypothetical protein
MVPGYNLNDIEFADTLRGMACGDSLVIVTTDGGLTWSRTLGVGEGTGHERRGTSGATIVRGVLDISSTFDCRFPIALRDISGRNVMELRPGANDVRQLPAGVYFVVTPHPCPLPQGARGPGRRMANGEGRMANAKVVIQR